MHHPLVVLTDRGLYCPAGDFYVDPTRAVERAVITHAHSDHARKGSKQYYCVDRGLELLRCRLGDRIQVKGVAYGETLNFGPVRVSFHSAGHILGSAQVRLECEGRVWGLSGDYKRDPDPSCDPFEIIHCDTYVTEATFGTPGFTWAKEQDFGRQIRDWWEKNAREGVNSIVFGYSLGKCQRILAELAPRADRPVLLHSAAVKLTECYRRQGVALAATVPLEEAVAALSPGEEFRGELILAPPAITQSPFAHALGRYETAFASGWMQSPRPGLAREYSHGFVMSDHADWDDLNRTIEETGARTVYVQHRGSGALVRHLRARGLDAHPVEKLQRTAAELAAPVQLTLQL